MDLFVFPGSSKNIPDPLQGIRRKVVEWPMWHVYNTKISIVPRASKLKPRLSSIYASQM